MERRRFYLAAAAAAVSGFLAGTALPELTSLAEGSYAGLISAYGLKKFEGLELRAAELLPYVLKVRIRALAFLWMSCYTPLGLPVHLACLFWLGAAAGVLLSVFVLRQGGAGAVLFLCCIFPQWTVYLSVLARELSFLFRRGPYAGRPAAPAREQCRELAGMLLLCALGAVVEACFGLRIFQIFLRYL